MTRLPVDHDVRQLASSDVASSIALTAGAGAGKTSVLVSRIAATLRSGVDPARIAAITFTEKAASEILHRVRVALEEEGAGIAPAALAQLTISTLHSFARGLLVAEPLESGWAPGTEIRDQASVAAEVDAWWAELRVRDRAFADRVDELCSARQRRALATVLLDCRDLRPRVAPPQDDAELFASLVATRDRIEAEAARCLSGDCKLLRSNDDLRAALSLWVTLPPAEAVAHALAWDGKVSRAGGRKGDWPHGKEAFKDALNCWDGWRSSVGGAVHGRLVRELQQHVLPAVLRNRGDQGLATQQDLLFRAADLLRDHDEVRARLAARFDSVLIDEVQDTDPLQAEVALLLARDAAAQGPWTEAPPRPGALFAVGDPQQSIYRFRRADVQTWGQLSAAVGLGGRALDLTQNFRSVPGVLAWVRQVFGDGAHPQVAWREPAELDPVVVVHTEVEHQIEHAVAWVSELMRGGRVTDRESGELRPITPGDLLFLVPRWKNAGALAQRLERAGVPADVDGGRTFFQRDEVRLSLALLSCLVEPGDTESTALALRGLFGLTLADLAAHAAAGGGLRLTLPEHPPGPTGAALRALAAVRRESGGGLVDLLDRALHASGAAAAWVLRADASSRFANLDKVRKLVRDEERAGGTRFAVLERVRDQARADSEAELSLTEPDQSSARITSIFKAKGLEAPVVVLLDLNKRISAGDSIVLRARGEVLVAASKGLKPPGWDEAVNDEKAEVTAEVRRLAYVAATRARDQLVVLSAPKQSIAAVYGPGVPPRADGRERVTIGGAEVLSVSGFSLARAPSEDAVFPGEDAAIDAALQRELPPDDTERVRAEQLALRVREAKRRSIGWEATTERAGRRRGRGRPSEGSGLGPEAARLGEVLHKVLEHLDLRASREDQLREAERLTPALVKLMGIADKQGTSKVLSAVSRILTHPLLDRTRGATRHLKEVPFVTGDGPTRVTGTIDLAFPLDAAETHWQVVDWKIHVPQSGPDREQYDAQLALYAKAVLAAVSPCERVDTALVGPHAELPAPPPPDDSLEQVAGPMRGLLSVLLAAGAPAPAIGVDIGGGLEAELVWADSSVAVLLGPSAEAPGWTLFAEDADPAEVLAALGVPAP